MKKLIIILLLALSATTFAQTGIGTTTPNASAQLDVTSTTKGFLPPRVALESTTSFAPLAAHVAGMIVYNTATVNDVTPGLYINNGTVWKAITSDFAELPTVSTTAISNITISSASCGGNISGNGGSAITASGVCWSTSPNPTTANSKTTDNVTTGAFTSLISGLTGGSTYYLRAYATNSIGTAFGTTLTMVAGSNNGNQTFNYTGASQTFTVPAGVSKVQIECSGAQGASNVGSGGLGGYAKGMLDVSPGQVLYIYVGGQPAKVTTIGYHTGGWNGGGQGYTSGQSGGGASDVRVGSEALGQRVIVAGGGGGDAGAWAIISGGDGGGTNGGNGLYQGNFVTANGGAGGTQSAGGSGGNYAQSGSLGLGGTADNSANYGGGGGGGYYGGGGAYWSGGGGGSGYIGGVSASSMINGYNTGNGQVIISW